jgi:integrase
MVPASAGKLQRRTYGDDLNRMLDDWARTWGVSERQGDTVSAALDAYLGQLAQRRHRGDIAQATEADYRKHAASVRTVWGQVRLADVDPPGIAKWRDIRGAQSPVQFNHERTILLEAFKVAIERGMAPGPNPVTFVQPIRRRPRDRLPSDDDVNAVLCLANQAVQAAAVLAVYTGLRQGDILSLKRSDFGESGLTIRPSKTTGKTRKALHFPWSPGLRQACQLAERKVTTLDGYWLTRRDGKPYSSTGFRAMWQRAMTSAMKADPRLERFTFHDLRAKAGTESKDWQLLGHLDQKTHSRVYDRKPRRVTPVR